MNALQGGFAQLLPGRLPSLVMFDLDGTLIDSVPDLAAAVDQMLLARDLPVAGIERVRNWVGNGARVLVRRAARRMPSRRWSYFCSCMPITTA